MFRWLLSGWLRARALITQRVQRRELARLEQIESKLLHYPQVEVPLTHRFAPGVYLREVMMPAGSLIVGHEHKTRHFNIVLTGKATVMMDGVLREIEAPCTFVSEPGVRKVLYIHEDMRWQTVHPTEETDVPTLEKQLVVHSQSFRQHAKELEQMRQLLLQQQAES